MFLCHVFCLGIGIYVFSNLAVTYAYRYNLECRLYGVEINEAQNVRGFCLNIKCERSNYLNTENVRYSLVMHIKKDLLVHKAQGSCHQVQVSLEAAATLVLPV